MAQHRSSHRTTSSSYSANVRNKKYSLRHPSSTKRALAFVHRIQLTSVDSHASLASASSSDASFTLRPILTAVQPNLRRLPSRQNLLCNGNIRDATQILDIPIGSKRKRVVSVNENAHAHGRSTSGPGRPKRFKSITPQKLTSDDDSDNLMDVDSESRWSESGVSDADTDDESSDQYLIHEAPARKLLRLRKDELVHLYNVAGLSEDAESFTKPELVEAIVAMRDDIASPPPSSPPRRPESASSNYSSDDGNVAGDEETDLGIKYRGPVALRRRATVNCVSSMNSRVLKSRSLSMGQLIVHPNSRESTALSNSRVEVTGTTRRKVTRVASGLLPTPSSSNPLPSLPVTRHRTRKPSPEHAALQGSFRGRGRVKQVEFAEDVEVRSRVLSADESELTDLSELEKKISLTSTSQRRLRSRDKAVDDTLAQVWNQDPDSTPRPRRSRTRATRAKGLVDHARDQLMKDEATEELEGDEQEEEREEEREEEEEEEEEEDEGEEEGSEEGGDEGDDDEIDELVSSPSPTPLPPRGRQTPVKRRLRPRKAKTREPMSDDGGEGDDECEETVCEQEEAGGDSHPDGADSDHDDPGDNQACKPCKLRSGKVVGGEELYDIDEAEELVEPEEAELDVDSEVDLPVEEETVEEDGDEAMDDGDFDLTLATKKSLVRLRRDDLVRLCETRDLDVAGTKPQLAQSLLQWRDRHANGFSSPSSTCTVRPPSTPRTRGRRCTKSRSKSITPPYSQYAHRGDPRIPLLDGQANQPEPDLELDLESLGLEDREIPPDKLTKLEKIGSGGFKDVYIGKFKGRRVAIAEFRDQLSAMDIKELKLLGGFDHPNIVRFLGVSIPDNPRESPVMMVSELCANGDLFDYVRNVPAPSLYKALSIMLDVARGLEYLHTRKPSVIHRDCKSSNILITSRGIAKIADFGLAKVKQSTRSMVRSLVGTVNWQAPELWHAHPKYNHKVDVFSCAMVFWEMLQWHATTKRFPWEGMNEHAIYEMVGTKRQRPSINGSRKQWCSEIVDLIETMWSQDPAERPTMTEVVQELEHLVSIYR